MSPYVISCSLSKRPQKISRIYPPSIPDSLHISVFQPALPRWSYITQEGIRSWERCVTKAQVKKVGWRK